MAELGLKRQIVNLLEFPSQVQILFSPLRLTWTKCGAVGSASVLGTEGHKFKSYHFEDFCLHLVKLETFSCFLKKTTVQQ